MITYAQLDGNKICIGISHLSGEVKNPNLTRIEEDEDVLGKKYDGEKWLDVPKEPEKPSVPEPDEKGLMLTILNILVDIRMGQATGKMEGFEDLEGLEGLEGLPDFSNMEDLEVQMKNLASDPQEGEKKTEEKEEDE